MSSKRTFCVVAKVRPSNIHPISKPTKVVEEFLHRQQQNHVETLENMNSQLSNINDKIEKEIYEKSEFLKVKLLHLRFNTHNTVTEKYEQFFESTSNRVEIIKYHIENITKEVTYYQSNCLKFIEDYYRFLNEQELKRSEETKLIIKQTFEKFRKIHYHSCEELFETKLRKFNEITLNNHHIYAELCKHLKLQILEDTRIWQINLSNVLIEETDSYLEEKLLSTYSEDGSFLQDSIGSTITVDGMWSRRLQETMNALDENARTLIRFYNKTVIYIYNRRFHKLRTIKEKNLDHTQMLGTSTTTEIFQALIENCMNRYGFAKLELQHLYSETASRMESCIQKSHQFLQRALSLWDSHLTRMETAEDLIIRSLKISSENNSTLSRLHEVSLNLAIDKLRQMRTPLELDKGVENINRMMDEAVQLYEEQCLGELNLVKDYFPFVERAAAVLIAEINQFLEEALRDTDETIEEIYLNGTVKYGIPINKVIPFQLRACKYIIEAVKNWKLGLWEAIKVYLNSCEEELNEDAKNWVDSYTKRIQQRFDVKLSVHKPRYNRLKFVIYNTRLKELQTHQQQYETIQQDYKSCIKKANELVDDKQNEVAVIVDEFIQEISKMEEKAKVFKKSQKVSISLYDLKRLSICFDLKIQQLSSETYSLCNHLFTCVKRSLYRFNQSMKLFSEGGDWNSKEAKTNQENLLAINTNMSVIFQDILHKINTNTELNIAKIALPKEECFIILNKYKENLETKEKVLSMVNDLRQEMASLVYATKYQIARIHPYIKHFLNLSKVKCVDIEKIKQHFLETTDKLEQITNYLNDSEAGYKTKLNGFISESLNKIQKYTFLLQSANNSTTNDSTTRLTEDDNIMTEVSSTYENYKYQVKMSWIECCQLVIDGILKLWKNLEDSQKESMYRVFKESTYDLEQTIESEMNKIQLELDERAQNYLEVYQHAKITSKGKKVIFLETMEVEENDLNKQHDEELDELIAEIMGIIWDKYESISTNVFLVYNSFNELINDELLPDLMKQLLTHLETEINTIMEEESKKSDDTSRISCSELIREDLSSVLPGSLMDLPVLEDFVKSSIISSENAIIKSKEIELSIKKFLRGLEEECDKVEKNMLYSKSQLLSTYEGFKKFNTK